jgi:hypothetical protein
LDVGEVDEDVLVPVSRTLLVEESSGVEQLVRGDSLVDAAVSLEVDHLTASLPTDVRPATGRATPDEDKVHVTDLERAEFEAGAFLNQIHALANGLPFLVIYWATNTNYNLKIHLCNSLTIDLFRNKVDLNLSDIFKITWGV